MLYAKTKKIVNLIIMLLAVARVQGHSYIFTFGVLQRVGVIFDIIVCLNEDPQSFGTSPKGV